VTDEPSCRAAIAEASAGLGGIDALVYAPAIGVLARLADTDADMWRRTFDTNVVGAAIITRAAIAHLTESSGAAAYLSSIDASFIGPPRPGLGAYAVSKAALDKLVEAWRVEHPTVAFTRVVVGDCAGGEGDATTQFANGWDVELAGQLGQEWMARGLFNGLIDVDHLVSVVDAVLCGGASLSIPSITVAPRPQA